MKQQGQICPLSGAPLAESDLNPLEPLRLRISKWILQRSMEAVTTSSEHTAPVSAVTMSSNLDSRSSPKGSSFQSQSSETKTAASLNRGNSSGADDDLYDF